MLIKDLDLTAFRNHRKLVYDFDSRLNIFVGPNGAGKTNILEAIHLLKKKRSFRFSDNSILISQDSEVSHDLPSAALIKAHIKKINQDLIYPVCLKIFEKKKEFFVGEKQKTKTDSWVPEVILFSPESLNEVKQGQENRRSLIDDYLESLGKSSLVNDYSKILVRRNKILKTIKNDESQKQNLLGWLESLTEIFFLKSLELTENRIKTLKALAPYLSQVIKELSLNREKVDLEYQISGIQCLNLKDEKIREIMLNRRADLFQAELSSGISLWGPHRHEIQFLVQGKDARSFCSQGQQRTLILALKIAQILHYKATHSAFPILLLDDVLSELDSEKRNSLIKYLSQLETQVFLTTTDQTLLGNLGNVSTKIMNLTVDKFEN